MVIKKIKIVKVANIYFLPSMVNIIFSLQIIVGFAIIMIKNGGVFFMKKWLVIVPALYIAYVLYTRKKEKCSIRTGKKKEEAK